MGFIALLVLLQVAISITGGVFLARKGVWMALGSAFVLPGMLLLLAILLVFTDGYQAESWARALPFVAVGMVILSIIGAIGAYVAYRLKK